MALFGFGSKETIGLDIGSSSIKLAHIKTVGKDCSVKKFGVYPLPPDAIVDGAIIDSTAVADAITALLITRR